MALCSTQSKPKLSNTKSIKNPKQQKHKYPLNKSRSQCNITNPPIPPKPSTNIPIPNQHNHPKHPQLSSSFLNESSSTKIASNNDQSDILLIKKSPSYGLIHTNLRKPKPKPQNEMINLNYSSTSIPLKRSNSMILQDNNNLIKQYHVSKVSSNRNNNLNNSICSSQPNNNNTRLDSSTTAATYKSFCKYTYIY